MIINNAELVEMFGNQKNKESYNRTKKVDSRTKQTLLKRAKMVYWDVKDLGRGKYQIGEKREIEKKKEFDQIDKTINKYLAPLIVNQLIEYRHNDKITSLDISLVPYFEILNAISKNFNKVRHNKKAYCNIEDNDVAYDILTEFVDKIKSKIRSNLEYSLNKLQSSGILKWQKVEHIVKKQSHWEYDERLEKMKLILSEINLRATKEETALHEKIDEEIRERLEIQNKKQAYYGKKSKEYNNLKRKEYAKYGWCYFYNAYEVYLVDSRLAEAYIKNISIFDKESYSKKYKNNLISDIMFNIYKKIEDIEDNQSEDFKKLESFNKMCDELINKDDAILFEFEKKNDIIIEV